MGGEIIIHVGLHKTGTSFLQRKLFPKLENVRFIKTHRAYEMLSIRPVKDKITIISHETLSGKPGSIGRRDYRYEIADSLKKLFPNAKIILGTRELKPWVRSLYKQSVLGGNTLRYKKWKEEANKEYWEIEKYISYFKKKFDGVYIYRFADLVNNKQAVIKEMCDFIGTKVPKYKDEVVNVSLSERQIKMIRILNKIFQNNPRIRKLITSTINELKE